MKSNWAISFKKAVLIGAIIGGSFASMDSLAGFSLASFGIELPCRTEAVGNVTKTASAVCGLKALQTVQGIRPGYRFVPRVATGPRTLSPDIDAQALVGFTTADGGKKYGHQTSQGYTLFNASQQAAMAALLN
jgi:uncharacterized membrane protein